MFAIGSIVVEGTRGYTPSNIIFMRVPTLNENRGTQVRRSPPSFFVQ